MQENINITVAINDRSFAERLCSILQSSLSYVVLKNISGVYFEKNAKELIATDAPDVLICEKSLLYSIEKTLKNDNITQVALIEEDASIVDKSINPLIPVFSRHDEAKLIEALCFFIKGLAMGKKSCRPILENSRFFKQRYEELVHALPDIIYELDINGVITFISEAVLLIGYTPEELIGKHFSFILYEDDVAMVDRDKVLIDYAGTRTGDGISPKLFNERRGFKRKTQDLEIRIKRKPGQHYATAEFIGSVIAYGEVSSAGEYSRDGKQKFKGSVGIIRDITIRRKAEELLRKLYQAIDQLPSSVFILDHDFLVDYVNPAFFLLTGFSPIDVLGKDIFTLLAIFDEQQDIFKARLYDGFDSNEELIINSKLNTEIWVDFSLFPVRTASGIISNSIVLLEDINSKKVLEAALDKAMAASQNAEKARTKILANLTEDIKNPLINIIQTAELLSTDKSEEKLDLVKNNAHDLLEVLNEIIGYVNMKDTESKVFKSRFFFGRLIKEVSQTYKDIAYKKGLEFELKLSRDKEIETDPDRLKKILEIVLDNAVKFTNEGMIKIAADMVQKEGNIPHLKIVVSDTGIGIADVKNVFSPVDTIKEKEEWNGKVNIAGLVLAKSILVTIGGEISIESTIGKGTLVTLLLPDAGAKELETVESANNDTECGICDKYSLLLVDDNEVYLEYMQTLLEKTGYQVYCATGAASALEVLENRIIDIILMDIIMPGYSGLELAKVIRSYKGSRYSSKIPIFALSAQEDLNLIESNIFDEVLKKPVDINELSKINLSYINKLEHTAVKALSIVKTENPVFLAKLKKDAENAISTLNIVLDGTNSLKIDIRNEALGLKKLFAKYGIGYMAELISLFIEHYSIENRKMLQNILYRIGSMLAQS